MGSTHRWARGGDRGGDIPPWLEESDLIFRFRLDLTFYRLFSYTSLFKGGFGKPQISISTPTVRSSLCIDETTLQKSKCCKRELQTEKFS